MTALPVEDWVAVHDLVHRYAACVDDRDFTGAAALFGSDGVFVLPEPPRDYGPVAEHRGPAAIATALSVLEHVLLTAHGVTGAVFDAGDGPDVATGRIRCAAHHLSGSDDQLTDAVWHLRYRDRYVRTASGWRIGRREVHLDLVETHRVGASRL